MTNIARDEPRYTACINCGRLDGRRQSGRCDACRMHLSRHGTERPLSVAQLTEMAGRWGDQTFPRESRLMATAGVVTHLETEIVELSIEAAVYDPSEPDASTDDLAEEAADVVILALRLAWINGFDLGMAIQRKMATNRNRTWARDDATGTIRHVEV